MTIQVSFTADENLKNKAMEKAKNEGITLKTLFVYAMKGFVDGKIALSLGASESEPEVEAVVFSDKKINIKAAKLAKLLK
ncbi:MAG: hypothetical protein AAB588_04420 [Patescibacteria group bacterium]